MVWRLCPVAAVYRLKLTVFQLKVRREGEAVSSELEELRTKAFKSRKEVRQLEKALSQARVDSRDREGARREGARSSSVGSFLDSAKEKAPPQEEGKGSWVLSRKRGGGHLCASKGEGAKRAAPTDRTSGVGADRNQLSGERCGCRCFGPFLVGIGLLKGIGACCVLQVGCRLNSCCDLGFPAASFGRGV